MKIKRTHEQIVDIVSQLKKANVGEIVEHLPQKRSRQWVSTILNQLAREGKLLRAKSGQQVWYVLPEGKHLLTKRTSKTLINKDLQEDTVLDEIKSQAPFLQDVKENVDSILYYAFTEILNNAIEHSVSKSVTVSFEETGEFIVFEVLDKGIGVFKNIQENKHLDSELAAIQELLKGKTTTLPHSHTGEGIFFTSKIARVFVLDSFQYRLRVDNFIKDIFVEEIDRYEGTRVRFEIEKNSNKHLNDVFEEYQSEPGAFSFDKTKVHVKLFAAGTIYISRSQARRLMANLDKFNVIILDFEGIKTIGQAFADEIFRVFAVRHPHVQIQTINMNETVEFMVKRVQGTQLSLIKTEA